MKSIPYILYILLFILNSAAFANESLSHRSNLLVNGMTINEFNRSLYEYPDSKKLIGKYEGTINKYFADSKCFLEIRDLDSTSLHFELSIEQKELFKDDFIQRILSIRGYKKFYFTQALAGELLVKKSLNPFEYSFSYNYNYQLPSLERHDFGEAQIILNEDNQPLKFKHSSYNNDDIHCEGLNRINKLDI